MASRKHASNCMLFVFWVFLSPNLSAEPLVVIHPAAESVLDKRYDYYWDLLRAALEETKDEGAYLIKESPYRLTENRLIAELSKPSRKINIIRENYDDEIDQLFHPIRIPLLKGALGWRVFLIKKDMEGQIAKVNSIEDLRDFRIGAGSGWGNIPILRANKLPVVIGTDYESLFVMLMRDRFDLFSRGIMEAPIELRERKSKFPDMKIEKHLVLRYYLLDYFFVNKEDSAMADRIERGLNKIIENGIFDNIFDHYYWQSIESLNLDKRLIIDINNPHKGKTLPSQDRHELWLDAFIQKKISGSFHSQAPANL